MCGLQEALEELQKDGALSAEGEARIRTCEVLLSDGTVLTSVAVMAECNPNRTSGVVMPTATAWKAKTTIGEPTLIRVESLDGARADLDGNVKLRDGTYLHALEAVPAPVAGQLNAHEDLILRHVLRFLENKRKGEGSASFDGKETVLGYAEIIARAPNPLPILKEIERYVTDRMPRVSRQTIARILASVGLRPPRSRPRARPAGKTVMSAR